MRTRHRKQLAEALAANGNLILAVLPAGLVNSQRAGVSHFPFNARLDADLNSGALPI